MKYIIKNKYNMWYIYTYYIYIQCQHKYSKKKFPMNYCLLY